MKTINIISKQKNYPIIIENNLLKNLKVYLNQDKFYVIISDNQIPTKYITEVKLACPKNLFIEFPAGENSKSFYQYQRIISLLQENNIKRDACIIALGGGVTGDLSGFVASTYLRGIELIQIPTTLLAQIDSSVGGKVAINSSLSKNSVGSFYAPSIVLIDPKTLNTLSKRHINNGVAEMIKYGMINSKELFYQILNDNIFDDIESYIYKSLLIKQYYIEEDEFDNSLRQILNFGHTYGHAYEKHYNYNKYFHGEAVALGMIKVTENQNTRKELIKILNKYELPTFDEASDADLKNLIQNDKKNTSNHLNMINVEKIGEAYIKQVSL
ncbi:MAG: 3-dehydroquinate synthase [Tenericutes bacterium]|nr:3-dehydroquinate synthase [Mycoplasmatota bacterium]